LAISSGREIKNLGNESIARKGKKIAVADNRFQGTSTPDLFRKRSRRLEFSVPAIVALLPSACFLIGSRNLVEILKRKRSRLEGFLEQNSALIWMWAQVHCILEVDSKL
jgi:hypothetical protein